MHVWVAWAAGLLVACHVLALVEPRLLVLRLREFAFNSSFVCCTYVLHPMYTVAVNGNPSLALTSRLSPVTPHLLTYEQQKGSLNYRNTYGQNGCIQMHKHRLHNEHFNHRPCCT